jgi:hypothetical protein
MTPCQQLSDRMPAVALGHSRWSPVEEAHLASCADCQAEWTLVQAAGRLAASSPPMADPEVIGAAVRRRLADDRASVRRIRRWTLIGLGVAAAVAVALWTGHPATRRAVATRPTAPTRSGPSPERPDSVVTPPPLSGPAPAQVAQARPSTQPPRLDLPLPGIDEMSDADLSELLHAMDEPLAGASTPAEGGDALGDPDDRALAGALTVEEG